ncbi:hypothetical protein BKI52_27685 [marine bacterium AO1-C]|nr:hypothetical protein BKI52_27685 [marine bacterium AO1-C]
MTTVTDDHVVKYGLVLILGVFFLLLALWYFVIAKVLRFRGVVTTGRVKDVEIDNDGDGTAVVWIIEYFDQDKKEYEKAHQVHSSEPRGIGTKVKIVYDPKQPKIAEVNNFSALYGVMYGAFVLSIPLLIISLGYFIFYKAYL